jgi:hypothetical protein
MISKVKLHLIQNHLPCQIQHSLAPSVSTRSGSAYLWKNKCGKLFATRGNIIKYRVCKTGCSTLQAYRKSNIFS